MIEPIPDPLITVEQLRGLKGYSKATGENGERVRVKLIDHERVRPDSRGQTFEGTVQNIAPEQRMSFIEESNLDDVRLWMLYVWDSNTKVIYGFHGWLIESIERVDA